MPSVIRVLFTHHGANETHRNPNETLPPALPEMILGSNVDALTQLGGHNYSHLDKRAAPTLRLLDTPMTGLRTGSLDAPPAPTRTPAPLSAAEARSPSR